MAKVTAEEYVSKHKRRLLGSTEDIRRGVGNVTTAPGKAAAAAQEKMKANLIASIDNGTWAKAVSAVSLTEWQDAILTKGIPRIAAGLDAAEAKNIQTASKLLNAVDEVSNKVRAMPDNNLEDSIARMTAYARGMAEKKGTFK